MHVVNEILLNVTIVLNIVNWEIQIARCSNQQNYIYQIILFKYIYYKQKNGKNRDMRIIICWMIRALFICGGFHHLKVKGRKAETKDAPVLALAPHSSFFDALPVVYLGGPSIVAKAEIGRIPFFGSRSPTFCSVKPPESLFHLVVFLQYCQNLHFASKTMK